MHVIGILIELSIFTAIFGTYRATTSASSSFDSQSWNRSKPRSSRLHFVSKEVNISSRASDPRHLLFHLQGVGPSVERMKDSPKTLGISLGELEKCIPWIPMDSAIFISSGEGFAPTMLNRIRASKQPETFTLLMPTLQKLVQHSQWWRNSHGNEHLNNLRRCSVAALSPPGRDSLGASRKSDTPTHSIPLRRCDCEDTKRDRRTSMPRRSANCNPQR